MSRVARSSSSSDEITPIRGADNDGRNYNTSDTRQSATDVTSRADQPLDENSTREEKTPWYKRIAEKYGSVTLENKGSVARDHLALERTFLAWLRTSLAFASIGIAVTQLFRLNSTIRNRQQSMLPLSPLVGQSIPAEMVPFLQQLVASNQPEMQQRLGPTLLDQLLLLPAPGAAGQHSQQGSYAISAGLDDRTAGRMRHVGKPLGATFLGISILILFIGFHRYFESQHWIIRGKFPASRGSIFIVAFVAAALIVASLVVVLVIAPTATET